MSHDTPRTNSVVVGNSDPTQDEYEDLAAFARQLERELNAKTEDGNSFARVAMASAERNSHDARRYRFLAKFVEHMKWSDFLPSLKPDDEKYVTLENLSRAIDEKQAAP